MSCLKKFSISVTRLPQLSINNYNMSYYSHLITFYSEASVFEKQREHLLI